MITIKNAISLRKTTVTGISMFREYCIDFWYGLLYRYFCIRRYSFFCTISIDVDFRYNFFYFRFEIITPVLFYILIFLLYRFYHFRVALNLEDIKIMNGQKTIKKNKLIWRIRFTLQPIRWYPGFRKFYNADTVIIGEEHISSIKTTYTKP